MTNGQTKPMIDKLAERLAALETERAELLAARAACLRSWRAEGKSLRAIGELSGLSFARVKQILDADK